MPTDLNQIGRQLQSLIAGLNRKQRMLLTVAALGAGAALLIFVSLLGRGDYKTLYTGLSRDEALSLTRHLANDGIPSQMSADGASLLVPSADLDKARVDMAAKGLPQSGRLGFEIFDKPNWAGSDFSEQVNYQRALEGELERTIQSLSDVEAVRVHLVLPHESLFSDQERLAKASVLVKLRGSRLSEKSMNAITYLVSSAVDTLKPENVTIVDANGDVPILVHGGETDGAPPGAQKFESAMAGKIVNTLAPVVGANHVIAKVTVEYQRGTHEDTEEVYDPKDQVVLTSQITADDGTDTTDQGIPGAASNVPTGQTQGSPGKPANNTPAGAGAASSSSDSSSSADELPVGVTMENKTYAVGKTVRHTLRPPGGIKRISAAVVVDDAVETTYAGGKKQTKHRKRTPDEMKQIEALAAAAIGLSTARGDTLAVENLSFNVTPVEVPPAPKGVQKLVPLFRPYSGLIRYGLLLLAIFLIYLKVVNPLAKQLVAALKSPSTESTATAVRQLSEVEKEEGVSATLNGVVHAAIPGLPEGSNEAPQTFRSLKEAVIGRAEKSPAEAGRVIETWLREG